MTIGTILFRVASLSDAETISALSVHVFLDTYATEGVRPDLANEAFSEYGKIQFENRLREKGRVFLLAEAGSGLVGFAEVIVKRRPPPVPSLQGSELVRLYVQPQSQRKGIGRELIRRAEGCAGEHRSEGLWLAAWEKNANALAFYDRVGYKDIGHATYLIQGQSFGNRILFKKVSAMCGRGHR